MSKSEKQIIDEPTFFKEQILQMYRYRPYIDLLAGQLQEGKSYKHSDVEEIINKFKKGRVV